MVIESQESDLSYICLLMVSILHLSAILIFDFGIVPTTMWFFSVFDFIRGISYYYLSYE